MGILDNKLALITGASRGIGAAVAKRYAKEGASLILAARSVENLEKIDDEIKALNPSCSVTLVPIDLTSPLQIEEMIRSIASRFGKLDILVGNAGILGTLTPLAHQNPEEWQAVLNTNLTANWYLIRCADPLLQKAPSGRALFVTTGLANKNIPYWGAYAVSKAALEAMVKTYAAETKTTNLRVNLVDPGVVRTDLAISALPGKDPLSLTPPEDITNVFVELVSEDCKSHGQIVKAVAV